MIFSNRHWHLPPSLSASAVVVTGVGSGERQELLALGEAPNIAARLQGLAEPDTVVISAATDRLVQGLFECHPLGFREGKGIATPLAVYQVVREGAVRSRFEVAVTAGLTPLVGREEEVGILQRRWAQAKGGEGQAVLLNGEAGIGKSRLVQTLKEQVSSEGATRIEFRCSPYHQNSAFYPTVEHLQRLLQFAPHATPHAKLAKLQQMLSQYRFPQADTLSLLAALLSLPHPVGVPPVTLSPQKQKQKTLEALVAWIAEEAEKAPVFCAWEDLHWADPSTLEVLTCSLEQVPTSRLLVLLTFRPDFIPPWRPRSHVTQLMLNRLGRQQAEAMVEQVAGGKILPEDVVQQIVRKTDGVPLFVEELTKMVLESGLLKERDDHYELSGPLPSLAIPSTLQDSLMARLDRLAPVRAIAQLGATLGREFSYKLIHAVSLVDEATLRQGLQQLVDAEIIYQRGVPSHTTYRFKHALVRDVAYQSLLKSKRQALHQQIVHVLAEQFPELKETQPELLAHHYTEAGLSGQAIPYWQRAGQRAIERSAHLEAISHLSKGLELLKARPDTPECTRQEVSLRIALAAPLTMTKGYAAPEVEKAYGHALALCRRVGENPQLFPVLLGLWRFYVVRAEYTTAHGLGEQLLHLAQTVSDPTLFLGAQNALGVTLFYLGELIPARTHLEEGFALYNSQAHSPDHSQVFRAGQDPGVACLYHVARALWALGYSEQARQSIYEALALAQEIAHPFSIAYARISVGVLHQYCQNVRGAQEQAEAAITISTEQGFPVFSAQGMILRGWALIEQGYGEEGMMQIRQGLAAYSATGAELGRSYFLALLAEAYGKTGQIEEGLHTLAEALAVVDKKEERFYQGELHRLKGELLSKSEVPSPALEVEECFQKAVDIARHQQAKALELRAGMSLSRLWQQQGKKAEAQQLLAEIYGRFTEGFDTKDLQEAKALLAELSSP
jgi:predicted ATPase